MDRHHMMGSTTVSHMSTHELSSILASLSLPLAAYYIGKFDLCTRSLWQDIQYQHRTSWGVKSDPCAVLGCFSCRVGQTSMEFFARLKKRQLYNGA